MKAAKKLANLSNRSFRSNTVFVWNYACLCPIFYDAFLQKKFSLIRLSFKLFEVQCTSSEKNGNSIILRRYQFLLGSNPSANVKFTSGKQVLEFTSATILHSLFLLFTVLIFIQFLMRLFFSPCRRFTDSSETF